MQVENKTALITGGANGIGFACATELLRNGAAHVAILDLATSPGVESALKLNAEFGEGRGIFIVCDVTKAREFEAAFAKTTDEFGGLDIVINNAGIVNESMWELMIDVNLKAVVRGTILGLQHLGKDRGGKGGVIVNIASVAGLDPFDWFPVYAAAKHGVVGLSRSFGATYHYEKTGVRVIAICPSFTETRFSADGGNDFGPFVDRGLVINKLMQQPLQKPEVVGKALVEIVQRGESGSVWISENSEPVCEVFIPNRFSLMASSKMRK
ncbi:15-hydroxyprostaglandin dehydrogenase [NAD(+)]-like [Diprion similis]|uniref:15-hydroxyprostaglandin dehydrogenase [NAD(+)]-like n=1 Tax=Diprion similis TaxID=362088 RepID=UPI001EF7DB93|nr:15-hydroxyprostaglandin dehydrogenase [NAD(+)]-like [Diprion similis]